MNKVVTINLGGNAYQLEEGAYDVLRTYLNDAGAKLAGNPDKEEIIKDLEEAIGGKCSIYITSYKNVLTLGDIEAVLKEMGPVESDGTPGESASSESDAEKTTNAAPGHKRLYRIPGGEWISGVCTGLAAYFNIDVSLVRILFVLLVLITHGLGVLVYLVMMVVVPVARTPKDYENASGVPPITAQELVDRVRKGVEDFTNSSEWKSWKDSIKTNLSASHDAHRTWKQQRKEWRRAQKQQWKQYQQGQPQTFLSELNGFIWSMFGLLIMLFGLWYLYHHVLLVQQFIDYVHATWNSLFYALSRLL